MLLLQFSIGTVNDLADLELDRRSKPWKPLPAGLVAEPVARGIAIVAAISGLVLAALSGPAVLAIALVGWGAGILYDLRLRATPWSWLPYAVGVPLLPLYAALGAGSVAPSLLGLVALSVPAGAALAIANAAADVRSDAAAGSPSIATRLGPAAAARIGTLLAAAVGAVAWTGSVGETPLLAFAGAGALAAGLAIGWERGEAAEGARGRRSWELRAAGLGLLALAWVIAAPLG